MRVTENESKVANEIDYRLRTGDLTEKLLMGWDRDYLRWYARLLTSLTLLVGKQPIIYGQSHHDEAGESIEFVLVTESSVIVSTVKGFGVDDEPDATTRVIPRSAIATFDVRASMPIDQEGSSASGWPGLVEITVTYALPGDNVVLRFAATGYKQGKSDERGEILGLLDGLQRNFAE